tara:strand:- start:73 stop:213 length:141 start_codon:yes stop_codon:yes gene_type:complete
MPVPIVVLLHPIVLFSLFTESYQCVPVSEASQGLSATPQDVDSRSI